MMSSRMVISGIEKACIEECEHPGLLSVEEWQKQEDDRIKEECRKSDRKSWFIKDFQARRDAMKDPDLRATMTATLILFGEEEA